MNIIQEVPPTNVLFFVNDKLYTYLRERTNKVQYRENYGMFVKYTGVLIGFGLFGYYRGLQNIKILIAG